MLQRSGRKTAADTIAKSLVPGIPPAIFFRWRCPTDGHNPTAPAAVPNRPVHKWAANVFLKLDSLRIRTRVGSVTFRNRPEKCQTALQSLRRPISKSRRPEPWNVIVTDLFERA